MTELERFIQKKIPNGRILLVLEDFALVEKPYGNESLEMVHRCSNGPVLPEHEYELWRDISGCFYCRKGADWKLLFIAKIAGYCPMDFRVENT